MKIVQRLINPAIRSLQAYQVPPATGLIKLDAMENPYTWPDDLKQQWLAELASVPINRYPDPAAVALKDWIRSVMGVPDDLSIMLGNGSDELIQLIALALARTDRVTLTPEPGFVMYRLISQMVNTRYRAVPLRSDNFALDREAMLTAIAQYRPALIFLACPNNPTGNLFDEELMLEVIREAPGLVVVDEAYHAFAGRSFVQYLGAFDNLLVMRTLSKSGLAGLRLGYLIGSPAWLEELEKVRLPYNINALTQKTAEFVLSRYHVLEQQARRICRSRDELQLQLEGMAGLKVWPSKANFILFRTAGNNADAIYTGLRQRGILIKNLHGSHALLEHCLRVTVGTDEENAAFIGALRELV